MQRAPLIDLPDPEWLALLRAEVAKGVTIAAVARAVGMQRTMLSMLLSGTYPARMDKLARRFAGRVTELYGEGVLCPHLHRTIPHATCLAHAQAPMSTSNPDRLRHWVACRACTQNPVKNKEPK